MSDFLINSKPYEKQPGLDCPAPYVNVTISALGHGKIVGTTFKARIDTGADITCIPRVQAEMLTPLHRGKTILVRGHDGNVKKERTHLMAVSIYGYPDEFRPQSYLPERGVLLTDSNIGLIGMDIISRYWSMDFDGISRRFSVKCA